jgi:hypothetical protein
MNNHDIEILVKELRKGRKAIDAMEAIDELWRNTEGREFDAGITSILARYHREKKDEQNKA